MARILFTIRTSYPSNFLHLDTQTISDMVESWMFTLGEYSYSDISKALKVYMTTDTKGFPPTPGQLIHSLTMLNSNPEKELTAAEAWALVYKAICNLRWECPEEEFNKLPKACQRTIGTAASLAEIAAMDTDSVLIGEKARFIRQFDQISKNEKEYNALPPSIKRMIEQTSAGMIGNDADNEMRLLESAT